MPSIRELRQEASEMIQEARGEREELKAERDEEQRALYFKLRLAQAVGIDTSGVSAQIDDYLSDEKAEVRQQIEAAYEAHEEFAEALKLRGEIRAELRRLPEGASTAGRLQEQEGKVEDVLDSIEEQYPFIADLVHLERARASGRANQHTVLDFARAGLEMGILQEAFVEEDDSKAAYHEHVERVKAARSAHEEIDPREARYIYRVYDRDEGGMIYLRVVWVDPTEQPQTLAQARLFEGNRSHGFRGLYSSVNERRAQSRKEREELDKAAREDDATVDAIFDDGTGTVRLGGLTRDEPWRFGKDLRNKAYGPINLVVEEPGVGRLDVPNSNRQLQNTVEYLGLDEAFTFGENFDGLSRVDGERIPNFGRAQAFLLKAAGIYEESERSSNGSPSSGPRNQLQERRDRTSVGEADDGRGDMADQFEELGLAGNGDDAEEAVEA